MLATSGAWAPMHAIDTLSPARAPPRPSFLPTDHAEAELTAPANDGANGRAPPRKRTKKAQSCDPCRRRKLKCDRGWPCGACCDRNEQDACTWEDGVVPAHTGRDAQKNTLVLQKMGTIESQLDRLLQRLDDVEARLDERASSESSKRSPPTSTSGASGVRATKKRSREQEVSDMDAHTVGGMFGISWQPSSEDCMRRTLVHMHSSVPDEAMIWHLLDVYVCEMDWTRRFLYQEDVRQRAEEVLALDAQLREDPDRLQLMTRSELSHLIYTEAILLAIMGLALVFAREEHFKGMRGAGLEAQRDAHCHAPFFHEAMLGLSTQNVLEEPHMDFILCALLLSIGICAGRSPAIGVSLLHMTVHAALLLDLDVEPPESMPWEEASRRVHMFAMLCSQDWFCTTTSKRLPSIRPDPIRFPSIFGTPEQQSKYLTAPEQCRLSLAHLFSKASILDLQHEDYAVTRRLHDEAMRLRSRIPSGCDEPGLSESTRNVYTFIGAAGFDYFLLRIHLRFYVRGWDDPQYRLSRDTCFTSARHLLHVFRAAFSWKVPPKSLLEGPPRPGEWAVPDQVSVAARIWWLSNWATAGALLLVKHLTILSERDEARHWDQEREGIVQDLCIISRLLQYLSPITTFARDGYDAMQRVAAHALRETFHSPPGSQDNIVAHWAARLLQTRPDTPCKDGRSAACSSAEPMSLLNKMMQSSKIFTDRSRTTEPHEREHATRRSREAGGSSASPPSASSLTSPREAQSSTAAGVGTLAAQPAMFPTPTSTAMPMSSIPENHLDTFWAQFAVPPPTRTADIPPTLTSGTDSGAILPDPIFSMPPPMPVPDNHEWLTDVSALDSAFAAQNRDQLTSNQFNLPMDSLGPLTDDILRMFEGFTKRTDADGTAPTLPMT